MRSRRRQKWCSETEQLDGLLGRHVIVQGSGTINLRNED